MIQGQLEEFVAENERIRREIIERDRLAAQLRDKARMTLENNYNVIRGASPTGMLNGH
jgi:hypothetical protein